MFILEIKKERLEIRKIEKKNEITLPILKTTTYSHLPRL